MKPQNTKIIVCLLLTIFLFTVFTSCANTDSNDTNLERTVLLGLLEELEALNISDETKKTLHEVYKYWKGKTTSELATSYMSEEAKTAIDHGMFTPGNYFYNGIGHVTVDYPKVLAIGYEGIIKETKV